MKLLGMVLLLLSIGSIELIYLIRMHRKKEAAVYLGIFLCSLILSTLILKDVELPSPSRAVEKIVSTLIKR